MPSKQVEDIYNAGGFDGGPLGRPGRRGSREITERDALERLRSRIRYEFKATDMAAEFGVSDAFMSAVLAGKKRPTDTMLRSVGIFRRVAYFESE